MNVRTVNGTKLHKDIPTPVAALLQELGLVRIVIEEPVAPPTVSWGIMDTRFDGVLIARTHLGTTTHHRTPPPDCPPGIAEQFYSTKSSDASAAKGSSELEQAQTEHANQRLRESTARRW
ncbi:MAG: hypothetical protein ACRD20_19540 [Terriglobales bacterium]